MKLKKISKALLFPHISVLLILLPIAAALLIFSMVVLGTESIVSYVSYAIAAYTLTIWCARMPVIIKFIKNFKRENKYAQRWFGDARLRVNVTLNTALFGNTIYGIFHIWLGIYHRTFWFSSLGAYYICLAVMRFGLFRHTRKFAPGERMRTELKKYRATGCIFLLMNLALSLIIFFMVYWNRSFRHHMITAIAIAAYTFTSLTLAILSIIKYRKYNSPAYSASKAISLASACVSMLTLEATMFTTFSDGTMSAFEQKIMLGATGGVVSAVIIAMAIYMILTGTKQLKLLKTEVDNGK